MSLDDVMMEHQASNWRNQCFVPRNSGNSRLNCTLLDNRPITKNLDRERRFSADVRMDDMSPNIASNNVVLTCLNVSNLI